MKPPIQFVKGDATAPQGDGLKYIVHICNNKGAWGAGFVMALSKKWLEPELIYRRWFIGDVSTLAPAFALGNCFPVHVESDITVWNMVAQDGFGTAGAPPIRYPHVRTCLAHVAQEARDNGASIHMPRIGCGLAGGNWLDIELLIEETCQGVPVTVYDFA